jgi:hypothetical protein
VSHAGLVPVMAFAERAGLGDLVAEHVRPGGDFGANPVRLTTPGTAAVTTRSNSPDCRIAQGTQKTAPGCYQTATDRQTARLLSPGTLTL